MMSRKVCMSANGLPVDKSENTRIFSPCTYRVIGNILSKIAAAVVGTENASYLR